MAIGYGVAVSASLFVGLGMRKATAGLVKGATGSKLLILNTAVGATAGAAASFCNTYAMRYAEINKGIEVFAEKELKNKLGVSKEAASNAVVETA